MKSSLNPTLSGLLALCRMDRTWVRGEGVWLFDSNGRRFLDCYAQYGAVALGHNAPCVVDAVRTALDSVEPAMVQPYRAPYAEELASALTRLAPGDLSRCFLATTGAEAVEAAIKLVRARTRRPVILSATGSFHGKTLGALALTGQAHHAEGFGPLPPGFERVEFGDTDALAARFARDGAQIAGLFLEPIQGERGVHLPPPGYLARARELTARHGAALVFDEVQTGLGRTGRLFACEHEAVEPDILLLGKALGGGLFPLSACLASADFWDEGFALRHSSTFANNNVACRIGLAVLDQLTRGGLCDDVARKGKRLLAHLEQLADRFPHIVAAVRGKGLMSAIELRALGEESTFLSFLTHQGLYSYAVAATIAELASVLVLPTLGSGKVLRVAPPLVISDQELELAMDGIEAVFQLLDRNPLQTIIRALGVLDEPVSNVPAAGDNKPARSVARNDKSACGAARDEDSMSGLVPHLRLGAPRPDYAFIVHYTSLEDVVATDPYLRGLGASELKRFCSFTSAFAPGVVMEAPPIRSKTGAIVNGLILAVPLLPEEMARRGRRFVSQQIRQLVDLAWKLGARIVGLGGYTTPYSRRGLEVVGRGPAITTGNPLTAGMAFLATRRLLDARGLDIGETCAAVVGAAGSVGALCARLLARERPRRLVLIGSPAGDTERLRRLARELERDTHTTVAGAPDLRALAACQVVMTATAAGRPILDEAPLAPGTIICDIARPPDTSTRLRARTDLSIIEGGRVALPDPTIRFGVGNLQNLPDGVTLACLAETILLALEGERRDWGVGDDVPLAAADRMLALAARHGFRLPDSTGRRHASARISAGDSGLSASIA
jgi:acetylornithine/succinyldiaminopimelate/putrescine aminotransferase/predicted amino acid dehydrogenase